MIELPYIVAQRGPDGFELDNLLYLLIVLVFPLLNSAGEWIRKRSTSKKQNAEQKKKAFEVVVDGQGKPVLKPVSHAPVAPASRTSEPLPAAKPLSPAAPPPRPETMSPVPRQRQVRPAAPTSKPALPERHRVRPAGTPIKSAAERTRQVRTPRKKAPLPEDSGSYSEPLRAMPVDELPGKQALPAAPVIDLVHGTGTFDVANLRKAIILSEILAPPLSLRES